MTETVRRSTSVDAVIEIGHTTYPVIAPDSIVGTGFQLMLTAGLRSLRNAATRGEPERPETLHRFRVGVRRLRSLLSAFRKILPHEERRLLSRRLGSMAKRYSRTREWDVFLAATLRPMSEALPDEPALLELEACAKDARRRALPDNIDFHAETRAIADALDGALWLHQPQTEFAEKWDSDLKDFSASLLAKHHQRLRRRLKTVDLADQVSFHAVRIEAKKIRYPSEMVENLFDQKAADAYLGQLIGVQDVLGHLNDALIARQLLEELPLSSRAQGLVNGWLAREIVACRQSFPRAAKRLRKATPFWDD